MKKFLSLLGLTTVLCLIFTGCSTVNQPVVFSLNTKVKLSSKPLIKNQPVLSGWQVIGKAPTVDGSGVEFISFEQVSTGCTYLISTTGVSNEKTIKGDESLSKTVLAGIAKTNSSKMITPQKVVLKTSKGDSVIFMRNIFSYKGQSSSNKSSPLLKGAYTVRGFNYPVKEKVSAGTAPKSGIALNATKVITTNPVVSTVYECPVNKFSSTVLKKLTNKTIFILPLKKLKK